MRLDQLQFDFIGKGRIALVLSALLVIVSIVSFFVRGLNFGIDFTGGSLVEASYSETVDLSEVRTALANAGYSSAQVQHFGTARDIMIRLPPHGSFSTTQISESILKALQVDGKKVELRRVEVVGPQIGGELASQGIQALLWVLGGILIYIYFRFEWRFAVNSVVAMLHDVILTVGFFSILQLEFNLTVLAAVLATAGYSLNDTVVIFDRIRENFLKMRKGTPREVINTSVSQTLSRTIITGGSTLFVLIALYLFGGEVLHGFSIALIVGIVVGTYSSIFVAAVLALIMGVSKADLLPPTKEGAELDRP
jgi:preprotein translocase subunit SecF